MKKILHKVLTQPVLLEKPPVLVDIGASGEIHRAWRIIAEYSTCIAFDADTRDFKVSEQNDRGYKKLFMINRVVGTKSVDEMNFYLTSSPYCSSALEPDNDALESWAFRDLFTRTKMVKVPALTLKEALLQCDVKYVDWYKTDSQGTDLRLFNSLTDNIKYKILSAEFEPGIIDAYKQEDKLHALMCYMEDLPFWITSMDIKGSQRIYSRDLDGLSKFKQKFIGHFLRTSPGWCEIVYLNDFDEIYSERDLLLGWVIASVKKEFGLALRIANKGLSTTENPLFQQMVDSTQKSLNRSSSYINFLFKIFRVLMRRFIRGIKTIKNRFDVFNKS
jgi:hypothetical protein